MRPKQQPREIDFGDYLAIIKRRALWIIVPTVLVTTLGIGASFVVPARYTSRALVLIEQQKVPGDFVRSVVTQDLNVRLTDMAEKIFSRTRLQPLIERYGLYSDKNITIDEKIEKLREDLSVTPAHSDLAARDKGLPGFVISANASQPRVAQQLCGEIASLFLSENLRLREQSAEGTTQFLQSQLDDAKRTLDEQDANLAAFEKQYLGRLPGQEQTNQSILSSLNSHLDASTQALSQLEIDKGYMEAMLTQQTASAEAAQTRGNAPSPEQIETKTEQLQAELTALEARYTPDHPDVVKARRELESLKKELQAAPAPLPSSAAPAKPAIETPKAAELRAQLQAMQNRIAAQKTEQGRIQAQIKVYQGRLQLSPDVQERYRQLSRGYETAHRFYDELLAKKDQSTMATELERREEGEQFRLIDPPNYPEKPAFPNRLLFGLGGLAAGLCLGGGLAAVAEYRDRTLRSEADVLQFTRLETLAMVPVISSAKPRKTARRLQRRRKKRLMVAKAAAGGRV